MSMPTNFPIRPIKRPSDLNGIVNGQVPEHLLVPVGKRNSKMHHTAARGWRCLMAHLEPHLAELGIDDWDLASVDPRTYQRQCEIFDGRKYPSSGRYLPDPLWAAYTAAGGTWGKRDDGSIQQYTWTAQDRTAAEQWRRMGGRAMAAKPGTSPHGDALAVDLAVDDDDDSIADPITEAVVRFLMADGLALRCGFAWSTKSEPWHLQWFVGDDVPETVLAWEAAQQPDPDPTPNPIDFEGDPDMQIIDKAKGTPQWARVVIAGGRLKWIRGKADALVNRLVVAGKIAAPEDASHDEFVDLMRTIGTEGPSPFDAAEPGSVPDSALNAEWKRAARN